MAKIDSDSTVAEIEAEIERLKREIEKAEALKQTVENLTDAQKLATLLHRKQCHHNHTDACGWYYESWEKDVPANRGGSRQRWIEKAEKLLATGKPIEELIEIAELMA